jgi:hypothetical protein
MIKRVRLPGGQRLTVPFLTRRYALVSMSVLEDPADIAAWNFISFVGFDGGPYVYKDGYIYSPPATSKFDIANRWIALDSAILRGYDTMQIDFNEDTGIRGGLDVYVAINMVRL